MLTVCSKEERSSEAMLLASNIKFLLEFGNLVQRRVPFDKLRMSLTSFAEWVAAS